MSLLVVIQAGNYSLHAYSWIVDVSNIDYASTFFNHPQSNKVVHCTGLSIEHLINVTGASELRSRDCIDASPLLFLAGSIAVVRHVCNAACMEYTSYFSFAFSIVMHTDLEALTTHYFTTNMGRIYVVSNIKHLSDSSSCYTKRSP